MGNDEYIKIFLKKHNYDGNIIVQSQFGNTWDDVVSIICNEKDIPSKKAIDIEDIQYDILTDLPEDSFYQWLKYCETKEDISYKRWISEIPNYYEPLNSDNRSVEEFRKSVEDSINNILESFEEKYTSYEYSEDSDDDFDDDFDDI